MRKDDKERANKERADKLGFQLFEAIIQDDEKLINDLVKQGANINYIWNSNIVTFEPDFNRRNSDSYEAFSPLSYALYYSRERAFKQLLELGADMNYQPTRDEVRFSCVFLSPLAATVRNQDWQALDFLLTNGVNVNILDNRKRNALHGNINKIPLRIIDLLVERGIDLNNQNSKGETVIYETVDLNNTFTAKHLLKNKCSLTIKNNRGNTVLHEAVESVKNELSKLLIDAGANINTLNNNQGRSPLGIMVDGANFELFKYVIDKNIRTKKDDEGNTVFHRTAELAMKATDSEDRVRLVEYLIDHDFDVNQQNNDGNTPMMLMSFNKELAPLFKKAFDKGMSLSIKNKNGETIIDIAKKRRAKFMASYLESIHLEAVVNETEEQSISMAF